MIHALGQKDRNLSEWVSAWNDVGVPSASVESLNTVNYPSLLLAVLAQRPKPDGGAVDALLRNRLSHPMNIFSMNQ